MQQAVVAVLVLTSDGKASTLEEKDWNAGSAPPDGWESMTQQCLDTLAGRCGPKFGNVKCGGGGETPEPAWALYCNEDNGWCGSGDTHKDAQESDAYDFVANEGGPCDSADPSVTYGATVINTKDVAKSWLKDDQVSPMDGRAEGMYNDYASIAAKWTE